MDPKLKERRNSKMRSNKKPQTKKEYKRLNVSSPVERTMQNGEIETFWQNLGSAFESEKGITVLLNGLPTNGKLFISEPVERSE